MGFEAFAKSEAQQETRPLIPDVQSPSQQVPQLFNFQSYFSTTLLQKAILAQSPNNPIVSPVERQVTGYAVGLHPSSQTPLAVQFRVGGQASSSAPITLKPGQIIRPYGLPAGVRSGAFSGLRFGIPFGWLGGGLATLVTFQTPDANGGWNENTELIFHRARFPVMAPGAVTWRKNWPMRFPWTQATIVNSSGADQAQSGQALISIARPSRILVTLRLTAMAAPGVIRMFWRSSNEFGLDSAGAVITTEAPYADIPIPAYAALGVAGVSEYPVYELTGAQARIAADDGEVSFVSPDAALQGAYVDVVRYGYL